MVFGHRSLGSSLLFFHLIATVALAFFSAFIFAPVTPTVFAHFGLSSFLLCAIRVGLVVCVIARGIGMLIAILSSSSIIHIAITRLGNICVMRYERLSA